MAAIADPAEVVATAMRHGLRALVRDDLCRWFLLSSGLPQQRLQEGLGESGMRDVQGGVERGRFHVRNAAVARLLVTGAFVAVLGARAEGTLADADADDAVEHLLRLLGIGVSEARDIAHRPLRPLAREKTSEPPRRREARAPGGTRP